nr:N-6 DNA methylase [Caulobacter flavus]
MPTRRRQQLAAFFTPPHLCDHVFERLERYGYDVSQHRLLDPASGGAAFLVPAARRLLDQLKRQGLSGEAVVERARELLAGVEIEPGLARLSEMLLADVFDAELRAADQDSLRVVNRANGLKISGSEQFGAVISNPPYGRVFRASRATIARWQSVITDGHVNTYALFIAAALEQARAGGLVAVIVPTSFMSGPYFAGLREYILATSEVLEINIVEKRSEVFLDVVQDTCVLIMRKRGVGAIVDWQPPTTMVVTAGKSRPLGCADLPVSGRRAWGLPTASDEAELPLFDDRLSDLWEWGYQARSGYFVWNRSRARLTERSTPLAGEVPLIWANNIQPNARIELQTRKGGTTASKGQISCVTLPAGSSALIRGPAIVLQRTTNRSQKRRIVAGLVDAEAANRFGGFVTENHTIVVLPRMDTSQLVPIQTVLQLLNSSVLDAQYRRLSGTVSVSTKVLQRMGLPPAKLLLRHLDAGKDEDTALRLAYREALS